MKSPKTILITGANSGLGKALAIYYSAKGNILLLTGRNEERLKHASDLCKSKGAVVETAIIDVIDKDSLREWIINMDKKHQIDLVIANAGISGGTAGGEESEAQARKIMRTNVDGVLNTIFPSIDCMKQRKRGQIAIISSLASFRALPGSPAYSTSKAAIRFYGEALRTALEDDGVELSVVCPGYIKTPMTDINKFPMPFLMSAEKASHLIAKRLEGNPPRIAFPLFMYIVVWFFGILPPWLTDPIFKRLPKKG